MEVFVTFSYKGDEIDNHKIKKILSSIKGAKEVHLVTLEDSNIEVFAEWSENEINEKLAEITNKIPKIKVVGTEILTPA